MKHIYVMTPNDKMLYPESHLSNILVLRSKLFSGSPSQILRDASNESPNAQKC